MKVKLFIVLMVCLGSLSLVSCNQSVSKEEQLLTSKMDSIKDSIVVTEKIIEADIDKVQASLNKVDETFNK